MAVLRSFECKKFPCEVKVMESNGEKLLTATMSTLRKQNGPAVFYVQLRTFLNAFRVTSIQQQPR